MHLPGFLSYNVLFVSHMLDHKGLKYDSLKLSTKSILFKNLIDFGYLINIFYSKIGQRVWSNKSEVFPSSNSKRELIVIFKLSFNVSMWWRSIPDEMCSMM